MENSINNHEIFQLGGVISNNSITSTKLSTIGIYEKSITQLSKEEKLKRVESFVEKYNVESDDTYVYLYKAINLDGTNIHNSENKVIYEVGKVYIEKVDEDINKDCSYGLHASNLDYAINFGRGYGNFGGIVYASSISWQPTQLIISPNNPSVLYKKPKYKIFKVKIYKEHIVVPNSNEGKVRCSQMEILEEIEYRNAIEYKNTSITETKDNQFEYVFDVKNKYTYETINVKFKSNSLELSQDKIKELIRQRLDIMQKIYDQFEKSKGVLE